MDVCVKDEGIHLQTMILLQTKPVVQMKAGILPSKLKKKKKDLRISVIFFPFVNMIRFLVGRGVDES